MKSVVVITDSAVVDGGAAKVAIESALALADSGLDVTVFAGGSEAEPGLGSTVNVVLTGSGAVASERRSVSRAISGIWDRRTYSLLRELLESKPKGETVVHAHSWGSKLSPSVFSAVRDAGFPLIITAHDYLLGCPNACRYVFPDGAICEREPLSASCLSCNCDRDGVGPKVFRALRFASQTRSLGKLNPTVVYVSGFQASWLDKTIPAEHRGLVIANPVSVKSDLGSYSGTNGPVLCAGRVEAEKGMDLFCAAATAAGADALLVGSGSLKPSLISSYPDVEFCDWMSGEDLARRMLQSKALVFPSRWLEAAPLTPTEAQLIAGLPCIVSDACAARDSIIDGETGLVFESGNEADLERCIRRLGDPHEHARIRKNVLADIPRIRAAHDRRAYVSRLIQQYGDVLASEG